MSFQKNEITKSNRILMKPQDVLREKLMFLLKSNDVCNIYPNDIPTKWEKHGDLVIFPDYCFRDPVWNKLGDKIWDLVKPILKCERVARKQRVCNDKFRSSQVQLLCGKDGFVTHVDNKIKYTFDVTKCMFSIGNITEKLRIAEFPCDGEIVVDMYAGIGYFTLPFLVHAAASVVHACEWNPVAVDALRRNLLLNHVQERCVVHAGDNRLVCPEKVADRVNLGLIPSSEAGWPTACRALRPDTGGMLHVHGNVLRCSPLAKPQEVWAEWADGVCRRLGDIFSEIYCAEWCVKAVGVHRVKSYAPHISHVVADIQCSPPCRPK